MKLAYFPGCAATGTGRELGSSTTAACAAYGIELVDIPRWVCCGASAAHMTSEKLAHALPALSLARASSLGVTGILTSCAACYNRLRLTADELARDESLRAECEKVTGEPLKRDLPVYHTLQILDPAAVRGKARGKLADMSVACYYGCLLTRPRSVSLDEDPVNPTVMDRLVEACGLRPVDWPFKTECCGASLVLPRPQSVARLSARLLAAAKDAGAEAIVVACPLCHSNLDLKQTAAAEAAGRELGVPVLYLTEVVALALGVPESRLDLRRHSVPVPQLTR